VPPSIEALHARLLARRTESEEDLAVRRRDAEYELSRKAEYDHVVVNETDQIERTAAEIDAIIAAEHHEHASRRIRV
jgi:guanylate kinase